MANIVANISRVKRSLDGENPARSTPALWAWEINGLKAMASMSMSIIPPPQEANGDRVG